MKHKLNTVLNDKMLSDGVRGYYRVPYALHKMESIEVYDIVGFKGTKLIDKLIMLATQSEVSHVGIIQSKSPAINGEMYYNIYESWGDGFQIRRRHWTEIKFAVRTIERVDENLAEEAFNILKNRPYDKLAIVGALIWRLLKISIFPSKWLKKPLQCAEAVVLFCIHACVPSINIADECNTPTDYVSPVQIIESKLVHLVYKQCFNYKKIYYHENSCIRFSRNNRICSI